MPTFTQVFEANGTGKNGKPYTRWDYKTAEGERHAHFAATQEIPLNTPVALELSASGSIKSWQPTESDSAVQGQQESSNGSEAGRTSPVASGRDFQAEAEGKTRCALVSQLLPAMFTALPKAEQNRESAEVLLDWAFGYVFAK